MAVFATPVIGRVNNATRRGGAAVGGEGLEFLLTAQGGQLGGLAIGGLTLPGGLFQCPQFFQRGEPGLIGGGRFGIALGGEAAGLGLSKLAFEPQALLFLDETGGGIFRSEAGSLGGLLLGAQDFQLARGLGSLAVRLCGGKAAGFKLGRGATLAFSQLFALSGFPGLHELPLGLGLEFAIAAVAQPDEKQHDENKDEGDAFIHEDLGRQTL